jgi:hypothetical protein
MSNVIERKNRTVPPNTTVAEKLNKNLYNVLNDYRSYSYVITISALDRQKFSTPSSYRDTSAKLENIILKSSGKSVKGQSPNVTPISTDFPFSQEVNEEISAFNKEEGPGKFDFYINNLKFETIPIPSTASGNTLVSRIEFDVHEPYSVVGFIEALRVTALALGFTSYLDAIYLMKLEFWGYSDRDDLPTPVPIKADKTTRYFPFRFTKVDVDVDKAGTTYKCTAITSDAMAFTNQYGQIKFSLQMAGDTVKEILEDFVKKLNETNLRKKQEIDPNSNEDDINLYYIKFPEDLKNLSGENEIAGQKLRELQADDAIYQFEDISKTNKRTAYQQTDNPETYISYEPSKVVVMFAENSNIHSVISSVIRDSDYWVKQVDPETRKFVVDSKNEVKFWRIVPTIEYSKKYSQYYRGYPLRITYNVIVEYQHISRLQGYQADVYDTKDLNIIREYNYIYSGQNIDIQDLKIEFNNLFIERLPIGLGASTANFSNNSAKTSDGAKKLTSNSTIAPPAVKDLPATASVSDGTVASQSVGGNAGAPLMYPVNIVARDYYNSLLVQYTNFSMIQVKMKIVGDPLWISTGGLGNYIPEFDSTNPSITKDGEANFLTRGAFVKIYFSNPVDVDEQGINQGGTGLLKFRNPNIKFSGVYLVVKVYSTFRDGMFTQELELNRMPMVIDENDYRPAPPNTEKFSTVPDPNNQIKEDVGQSVPQSKRSSLKNVLTGATNFADSIQGAEARIIGSIGGALGAVTNAAAEVAAVPAKAVTEITNSITGKLQGINDIAVNAANKLGLTPTQLGSLSGQELLAAVALAKLLPDNLNVAQIEENRIEVTQATITSVPPLETKQTETNSDNYAASNQQKINQQTGSFLETTGNRNNV